MKQKKGEWLVRCGFALMASGGLMQGKVEAKEVDAFQFEQITEIPERMAKGQNGYAILLSEELKGKLKNLDKFIQHKQSLGFQVHVVTDKDWGGGEGLDSARNITSHLKKIYKEKNLLYVLLLGNPNPDKGDMAHVATALAWTDWPYMDLDSDWGIVMREKAKKGDRNSEEKAAESAKKGLYVKGVTDLTQINGQWDVLVGRIPWYGEDSHHWKAADVDVLLARTMRYENDKGDISWRYNYMWAEHGDGSKKYPIRKTCDKVGANYVRLWHDFGDTAPTDGEPNHVKDMMNRLQNADNGDAAGFVNYHSHGSGDSVCGTIHSKSAVELKDDFPAIHWFGACSVGTPRNDRNIVGTIFRFNGIACIGPSMSVTASKPNRTEIPGNYYTGQSIGENFWNKAKAKSHGELGVSDLNKTTLCFYLQGDPSVVPFKHQRHGSYLQVSPYAAQYDKVVGKHEPIKRAYTVVNNTDEAMKVTAKSNAPWFQVAESTVDLLPRKGKEIWVTVDVNHPAVKYGANHAELCVSSGKLKRVVNYSLQKDLEMQSYYNAMNKPVRGHRKKSAEKEQGLSISSMGEGQRDKAIVVDFPLELTGHARESMIPGYNSFTLSFWFKEGVLSDQAESKSDVATSMSDADRKAAKKAAKKAERKIKKKLEKNAQAGVGQKIASFGQAWTISITDEGRIALDIVENKFMLPRDQEGALATRRAMKEKMRESEDWSDFHVDGPAYDKSKWNHVLFSVDRKNKQVKFYVNGKRYGTEDKLSFEVPLLTVAKTYVQLTGSPDNHLSFDELRYFNFPVSDQLAASLYGGTAPDFIALPLPGDKRPPNNATLVWESIDAKAKRVLEYSRSPKFADSKKLNVTGKTSCTMADLENGETYFWRLVTQSNGKPVVSTASYFTTDSTVKIAPPVVSRKIDKKPPTFALGVQGADFQLGKYVRDEPGDSLSYEMLAGPKWLTLTSAGIIFTPYGPKSSDLGESKLTFKVSDQTGQSVEREIKIRVVETIPVKRKK